MFIDDTTAPVGELLPRTDRTASAEGMRLAAPACIGRTAELATLEEALAAPPAVVLVEGEAGIGKSRLLQEFLTTPAGSRLRCLVATCPPFREPFTLGPVVDAVGQATDTVGDLPLSPLAGALRPLFPEWTADLPPAPEPLDESGAARHRLFRAIEELLGCLRVAVLAVEDVHWADDATLEFLLFLVSRRPPPVSVVVTYRPEEVPAESLLLRLSSRVPAGVQQRRLVLGPLDAADATVFMSSMLAGERVSTDFAAFLHSRTDGVPLAMEESVRLMLDRGDLTQQGGSWVRRKSGTIEVPPSIRDAVLQRVARLDPDTRAVLHAAAVLTEPADYPTLAAVSGLPADRIAAAAAAAVGCGLLCEDARGLASFRHALICQAVYDTVPPPGRRALHLRAGETLERLAAPLPVQLARHFREAGETELWCHYAEQAADRAGQTGDEAGAAALLHRLVTTVTLPVEDLSRLVRKIEFRSLPSHRAVTEVVGVLRAVLDRGGLPAGRSAEVRYQLGRLLNISGAYQAGSEEHRRAMPDLPADSLAAARARISLGMPIGEIRAASEHLRWLRDMPELAPSVAPHERMFVRVDRAVALLLLGQDEGWREAKRVGDPFRAPQQARYGVTAHQNLGHVAMVWGRYGRARRHLVRALELADRYQFLRSRDLVQATRMHLDWFTGSWEGVPATAGELASQPECALQARREAALVAGLMESVTGTPEAAERQLRFASQDDQLRIEASAALARLRLRHGGVDEALALTDEPIAALVEKEIWPQGVEVAPVRVAALAAAGRRDEAADLVTTFARVLGRRHAPVGHASVTHCRATLTEAEGGHLRAAERFAAAEAAWRALPRPYDALLAREGRARCLLAAGDHAAGLSLLAAVEQDLSGLGARHDAARVRQALRDRGRLSRGTRRRGRPSYGDRLSPRELEVARLLVGGGTNRQIADALTVSPQTVASHLRSAMRKLHVGSRTTLALKVVQLGLVDAGGAGHPGAGDSVVTDD